MKPRPRTWQFAAWAAAALALAAVFLAYLNPHLAVDLAQQIRSCF